MEQLAAPTMMLTETQDKEAPVRRADDLDPSDGPNWERLLGRSAVADSISFDASFYKGKTVLITGAGGSIGAACTMRVASLQPRLLVLLDAAEHNLYLLDAKLRSACRDSKHVAIAGSVADEGTVRAIFAQYGPDVVFHAAAYKHVPLMETNPFAAMLNNALGTYRLAQAALLHGPSRLLMVSTDKAVDPASIMGASKRLAEIALQVSSTARHRMNSLRLGNVLGSQGSVVPLFLRQISRKETVTVTHADAERFFFTMQESVTMVLEAAAANLQGRIIVPRCLKSIRVVELAKFLIAQSGPSASSLQIVFTGLRPGEKVAEKFFARNESPGENLSPSLMTIENEAFPVDTLHDAMMELDRCVRQRDLQGMLQATRRLVPHYRPSMSVLASGAVVGADGHV
jgi:FlaA1/EpsC-like NDP-sugar epimerase